MAKYLFLQGMYYPRSSANGVCCKNIVDELIHQGHSVTCIVNNDITRPVEEYIDGAHVLRVKPRLHYRIQEWCYYHPSKRLNKLFNDFAYLINKVQLFIMSAFWPRISPMYTFRFYRKAVNVYKKERFDAVIAVYTPIDTLYAGYMLKRKFPAIKFIPYYLDALAGGWGPSLWLKENIDKRTRKLEYKIDKLANIVVSMESAKEYHINRPLFSEDRINISRVYLDVPTFVSHVKVPRLRQKTNKSTITIMYSGSIHFPDRDPRPLLKHFVTISKKADVELLFIGKNDCQSIFNEYINASNGKIKCIGQFSHLEAIAKLSEADILVNIGNSNPNTVPSKIFEYIQLRKPIISTYVIENEPSIPYLKKYGNYFLLDERPEVDFEKINQELFAFIMHPPKCEEKDFSKIFYLNTPQAFTDILDKLE